MSCKDELINVEGAFCLAKEGEIYVVYLPAGSKEAQLMADLPSPMKLLWFNPRAGGELSEGSVTSLGGPGARFLGTPPADP
jgi:hypothetical protein